MVVKNLESDSNGEKDETPAEAIDGNNDEMNVEPKKEAEDSGGKKDTNEKVNESDEKNVNQQEEEESPKRRTRKRKAELESLGVTDVSSVNTESSSHQRGKHGLRPVPQQVNYYQSVLEERSKRRASRDSRDSITQNDTSLTRSPRPSTSKADHGKVDIKEHSFEFGEVVWATLPSQKTHYPALYISHLHCGQKQPRANHSWVYWFGDHQVSEVSRAKMRPFIKHFKEYCKGASGLTTARAREALQVLAYRAQMTFPLDMSSSEEPLLKWAEDGFQVNQKDGQTNNNPFKPDSFNPIPPMVSNYLPIDAFQQQATKTDDRTQQIAFYEVEQSDQPDENYQIPEFKQSQVSRIRDGEIKLEDICVSCCCDHNRLADSVNGQKLKHPLFEGSLCALCRDILVTTMYAPGFDDKNSFCTVCGQVGKLTVCEEEHCHRVYCKTCINIYINEEAEKSILESDNWKCFICKMDKLFEQSLLKPRADWRQAVKEFYDPMSNFITKDSDESQIRPLRVLSLCDTICATKVALKKLGVKVESYYVADCDKDEVKFISQKHDDVEILGTIESLLHEKKLEKIAPIDLIIGGSPCIEPNSSHFRKDNFDLRLGGKNFFYFYHYLRLLHLHFNKGRHLFFYFDGCASMPSSNRDVISDLLMCKPVTLSVKNIQSYARTRYLWSNIPGVNRPLSPELHEDYAQVCELVSKLSNKRDSESSPPKSRKTAASASESNEESSLERLEKLLGLPIKYTEFEGSTKTKRVNLLGKSWSASILSNILWSLYDFTEHEEVAVESKSIPNDEIKESEDEEKEVKSMKEEADIVKKVGGDEEASTNAGNKTLPVDGDVEMKEDN